MAGIVFDLLVISVLFGCIVWNAVVEGKLSLSPKNVIAPVGNRVELRCSYNGANRFIWDFLQANSSTDETVSFGNTILEKLTSRYRIVSTKDGEQSLLMESLDMNHAGRYRCNSPINRTIQDVSEVTVLAGEPECGTYTGNSESSVMIIEGSDVLFWCRISYTGNTFPTIKWNIGDMPIVAVNNTIDNRSIPFQIISSLKKRLEAGDDGVVLTCRIIFHLPNSAENDPLYEYSWNNTARVLYGPKNVTIHPNATTYRPKYGDELRCSASGNPTPSYQWMDMNNGIVENGPILKISDSFEENKEHRFTCTAVNEVAIGRRNASISLSFTITGHPQSSKVPYLIGGFSIVFLLGVVAVISYFAYRKYLQGKDNLKGAYETTTVRQEYEEVEVTGVLAEAQPRSARNPPPTVDATYQEGATNSEYAELTARHLRSPQTLDYEPLRLHVHGNTGPLSDPDYENMISHI